MWANLNLDMDFTLSDLREAVHTLSKPDQARLLTTVASEVGGISPGIAFDPDVCGGCARINRTRIPVWTLESARRQGLNESEILNAFPRLNAEDLVNAWAYIRSNKCEIDDLIAENEAD